jgi:hydrogenase maturation protease
VATPRDWNEEAPLVVLGMGNLIYSDDGAGLEALNRLGRHPRLPEGVELIDGSLGGLEAAARISRTSRLLIFDAVDVAANPGTVIRMTGDELAGLPGGAVVHRLGVPDLLSVLRLAGWMPSQVLLLGVSPNRSVSERGSARPWTPGSNAWSPRAWINSPDGRENLRGLGPKRPDVAELKPIAERSPPRQTTRMADLTIIPPPL